MISSDTDYDAKVTLEAGGVLSPEEPPFHILLLGDWSGKEYLPLDSGLSELKPVLVDRDNFEEVLKKFNIRIELSFQNSPENVLSLDFNEFDDFHPDKIFQRLPLFSELREVRRRLLNSDTFEVAAQEVRSWIVKNSNIGETAPKPSVTLTQSSPSSPNNLLNEILGQSSETAVSSQKQTSKNSELNTFIRKIVEPHLIQTDSKEQSKLLMIIDEVVSDLMRKILHHPTFQALESAWRGLFFLIKRIETGNDLKIFLVDVSKSELQNNLKSVNDLTDSKLYSLIAQTDRQFSQNAFWSVMCGNYNFSLCVEDTATLLRVAKIANDTNTPFISSIAPEMFGFKSFGSVDALDTWKLSEGSTEEKLWTMLRASPEAVSLGLMMPRFMSRLPYGEATDSTEAFYFEEFTNNPQHQEYLWSNSSFIITFLLAQTFDKFGWNFSGNLFQNVEGMTIHSFNDEGEFRIKTSTEINMTQTNCENLLNQGLMPIVSIKNSDNVRLMGFQSIALPSSSLKGRWK